MRKTTPLSFWRLPQLYGAWTISTSTSEEQSSYSADYKPLEQMGHLHSKTFNQLQMALMEHNFIMQNRQTANLPSHLKLAKADLTQNISNTHLHVSTQIYKPGQPSNNLTNIRQPPTKILSQISQPQTQTST